MQIIEKGNLDEEVVEMSRFYKLFIVIILSTYELFFSITVRMNLINKINFLVINY